MSDWHWTMLLDAQLRYYMHIIEPENLSDEEWLMRVKELEWIRESEKGKPI